MVKNIKRRDKVKVKKLKRFMLGCAATLLASVLAAGSAGAVGITVDEPNDIDFKGSHGFGTATITMTSADPGNGTITPTTTSGYSYYITTDATGTLADKLDLDNGAFTGQQIRVTLAVDGETVGLNIVPGTKFIGTSTLLEDKGDCVTYEWTGGAWNVVSNIGGTEL